MIRNRSIPRIVERYDPSRNRSFHEIRYYSEPYGSEETHPLHVQEPPAAYIFPGIWPFIERAQSELGCDLHQYGRARSLWHVSQMQNALGQLPKLDVKSQRECLEHINKNRMSLACALLGVDNAILDACVSLGLPLPDYLEEKLEVALTPEVESTVSAKKPHKPKE